MFIFIGSHNTSPRAGYHLRWSSPSRVLAPSRPVFTAQDAEDITLKSWKRCGAHHSKTCLHRSSSAPTYRLYGLVKTASGPDPFRALSSLETPTDYWIVRLVMASTVPRAELDLRQRAALLLLHRQLQAWKSAETQIEVTENLCGAPTRPTSLGCMQNLGTGFAFAFAQVGMEEKAPPPVVSSPL